MSSVCPARLRAVLIELGRAANAGEMCPTNDAMATKLHMWPNQVSLCLVRLKREGAISTENGTYGRIVTITTTGKRTAGRMPGPPRSPVRSPKEPRVLPPRIFREPCPRCGIRADVGCVHLVAPEVFA